MRIYLIGYMGCGKTTMGRKLASQLSISFIDMDNYIQNRYFKSISDIFSDEGEESFRKKERDCLMEISEMEDVVVSTGGGAPCFFDNIDLMNNTGICIFLDVKPEILAARLRDSHTVRPLIQQKKGEELISHINDMLQKRFPFYNKASYRFSGDDITVEKIIQTLHLNDK